MSTVKSTKRISFSNSPAAGNGNRVANIRKVYFSPPKLIELPYGKIKLSDSLSKFPKNIIKLDHYSSKHLNANKTSFLNQSKELSESHSYVDLEAHNAGIEAVLKKKLRKEQSFFKKLDIVLATFEKLTHLSRNFSIFYSVISEFLVQVKDHLVLAADEDEKMKENEKRVKEGEDKMKEALIRSETELKAALEENRNLRENFEKLKNEERMLRATCKKQAGLLNKLQDAGYPVEKFYELSFKTGTKSKSMNKIPAVESDEIKRPNSIHGKGVPAIPKLKFSNNEGNEGYQDEFMAKFNEFSESWRKQIIKDHHFK